MTLLGGFSVSVGARVLEENAWRLKNAAALVKLLALAPDHRLHREQVMDLLWPESGRKAASNSLRRVLHSARGALGPVAGSRYLASKDDSLLLCPDSSLWVDLEAFEEAGATARRGRDPAAYRAALDLYAGELLPADRYEGWAEEKRGALRRLYLDLLVELARAYEERGDLGRAVETLRMAVAKEPTLEEAHFGLMSLYALLGRESEALVQYERLREALSGHLGMEPGTRTRSLHEDIAAGRFPTSPRQHAGSSRVEPPGASKHNLPAPRSSFVGRDRELIEIKRNLAMTRLLTLTGAGGCGKTRLSLEVARDLVGAYPDGVWLVELAPLSEGELVPKALAEAVGTQEQPGRPITEVLVHSMRTKEQLLIVDNCEHLIEATALLVDVLLDTCPRLRILATSREPLDVAGELNWPVPSLSVPDGQPSTVEEVEGYESVRLFVERAHHRNPSFSLTPQNAPAVARICGRLEGIPLAIELAAARVGLSVEQIAERLDDSLGLLSAGSRIASPRQRTLRGTLDWSHALLGEPERRLFRRLSVFAGGWRLRRQWEQKAKASRARSSMCSAG
jgi:DNA-binding SARP family transcriptional activator